MANKFKVGDKVRLKKGLRIGKQYNGITLLPDMAECKEIYTVEFVSNDLCDLKETNYTFSKEMLELAPFTKDDLQTGDVVTLRNGDKLFIDTDMDFRDIDISNNSNNLSDINDLINDLLYIYDDEDSDIIKVERPTYTTVYEREENKVKEMTIAEISEALGYEVKIVKEDK